MKYWEVKAKANEKIGELLLYSEIANTSVWGDETTPAQIDAELKALGDIEQLNVRINSPGGSVFAGQAIHAIIKRHPAKVKCAYIDGLAASISSVIPLSCDKIIMSKGGTYMIHKPFGGVCGTADEMRSRADVLDKIETTLIEMYAEKTKLDAETIAEMLKKETWMTAKEALELGFIDEIENEMLIAASMNEDILMYGNTSIKVDSENIEKIKNTINTHRTEEPKPLEPVVDKLQDQNKEFNKLKAKILGGI